MATLIDSLIISLSLDPSNFTKGQKEVAATFAKTKDAIKKSGGEIEESAKKSTVSMDGLRGMVLELFAAFTAGRGLKDFIADVTVADAETGRLAKTLDTSTESLSSWQGAAKLVGGSSQGVTGSIQNLVTQFQQFRLTGESSIIPYMNVLGVSMTDARGQMRDMGDVLLELADKFKAMDPARAAAFGKALGFDQGTINLLIQGRKAVEEMLARQKELGVITKDDAKAGADLVSAWGELIQASTSMGRTLLTWLTPAMVALNKALTELAIWARQHGPFLQALFIGLSAVATGFAVALLVPVAELIALTAALTAAVIGIALLYDDWKTWTEGGKAEFGSFYQYVADKWAAIEPIVAPVIKSIGDLIVGFAALVKDEMDIVSSLFSGSAQDIRKAWGSLFGDIHAEFENFIDFVKKLGPVILDAFKIAFTDAFDWLKSRFNTIWEAAFGHKLFEDGAGEDASPSVAPPQADHRTWYERHAPKWLGGKDAPGIAGSGTQAPAPGKAGTYRPVYNLGASDLDPRVINTIAGEAQKNGQSVDAVINNMMNRVGTRTYGPSGDLLQVSRAPGQYTGYGNPTPEHAEFIRSRIRAIASGGVPDNTNGSNEYRASSYGGPWYRNHADAPVIGGNRFAYNPAGGRGPYAPYANPRLPDGNGFVLSPSDSARAHAMFNGSQNSGLYAQTNSFASSLASRNNSISHSSEVNIENVHVNTQANDAEGIAKDIKPALGRSLLTSQANYGLN